ncbi:transporter [Xanthobacter sp. TB0139]|uniref:transporter n=1 Tax=Xanthobacter sp. TB0139 TaxID=3459178 RepID=UPI004039AE72
MKALAKAAAVTAALGLSVSVAEAGSKLMPGISTGIHLGFPLPEGAYLISIPTYGSRDSNPRVDSFAAAPAWLIWSTPWEIAGGRLLFDTVMPFANVNIDNGPTLTGFANPILDMQIKWDLGNNFYGGFQAGVYLPIQSDVGDDWASFQGIAALSYLTAEWQFSTTLVYGTGRSGVEGGPAWFNADFTAIRKFGKFELGAVAFASTDLSSPYAGYQKQSQFAAGGLIGYDFGAFSLQLKLTTDLYEDNYGGRDTRAWANIVVPFWSPKPSPAQQQLALE